MYRYLTNDESSEARISEIDKRLEIMLDDGDVDLVVDKRELNQGRKAQFEAFWKGVDSLLEEYGKAVDDRRHGPDVAHMPQYLISSAKLLQNYLLVPPYPLNRGYVFNSGHGTDFQRLPNIIIVDLT
jgi:hypothetical protein